jgi:hypothetical protein
MRYIPLNDLLKEIFADAEGVKAQQRLFRAHKKAARMDPAMRHGHCKRNGTGKWSPVKDRLTAKLGNKCWYTEAELVGAHLTIDHYRPVCHYWWLAYDPENYRVACSFANSPEDKRENGSGGKGDKFPLLGLAQRARGRNKLRIEKPVILDPSKHEDCELLAFQPDGQPILNPKHAADPIAARRVDESKILLNLNHPDFNSKREQLYHDIADDVKEYEELPPSVESKAKVRERISRRLAADAPFSTAARFYLKLYRNLDWVEALLNAP